MFLNKLKDRLPVILCVNLLKKNNASPLFINASWLLATNDILAKQSSSFSLCPQSAKKYRHLPVNLRIWCVAVIMEGWFKYVIKILKYSFLFLLLIRFSGNVFVLGI